MLSRLKPQKYLNVSGNLSPYIKRYFFQMLQNINIRLLCRVVNTRPPYAGKSLIRIQLLLTQRTYIGHVLTARQSSWV